VYRSPVGSLNQLTQVRLPCLPSKMQFASSLLPLACCLLLPCMLAPHSGYGSSPTCPACANCVLTAPAS
jgi:hypothetical protein